MTSTHFATLIQSAELHSHGARPVHDPRFVPTGRRGVREVGAGWLRTTAKGNLWLALRTDPRRDGQSLAA